MKRHNYLVASLVILIGMGAITVSCKKECNKKNRKAQIVTCEGVTRDGGGDDEDPIIQGKVKKQNFTPVDTAFVETMAYGSNIRVGTDYTNNLGEFEQKVDAGIYYFRITPFGESTPFVTDTVHVADDIQVTIIID